MGIILLTSCAPKNPNNESRTVDSKYPKYSNTKKQAPEGSLGGSIEGFYPDPPNFDSMSNHEIEEYITSDDPTDPVSLDISSIYKSKALKALIGNINSNKIHELVLNLNPIILDNNRPNHLRHRLLRNDREIIDNTFHTEPTLLPTNEKQQIYNSIYSLLDTFTTQYHPFLTTNALTLHVKMDECSAYSEDRRISIFNNLTSLIDTQLEQTTLRAAMTCGIQFNKTQITPIIKSIATDPNQHILARREAILLLPSLKSEDTEEILTHLLSDIATIRDAAKYSLEKLDLNNNN